MIQVRTIFVDAVIFAENLHRQGHLTGRDYAAYRRLYETVTASLDPPDLLIYLKSSLGTIKKRIRLRGRAYEAGIDPEYLKSLHRLYARWIRRWNLSPVLVLDADRLDFLNDLVDRIELLETIEKHL